MHVLLFCRLWNKEAWLSKFEIEQQIIRCKMYNDVIAFYLSGSLQNSTESERQGSELSWG